MFRLIVQARSDIERMKGKVQSKVVPQSLELCTLPVVLAAQEHGGKDWLQGFLVEDKPGQWVVRSDKVSYFMHRFGYPSNLNLTARFLSY